MEAAWLEGRIRQEFDKLREFLRVEEQAILDAMAEEARQKQRLVEEKMKRLAEDTEALAQEIERLQVEMKEDDVSFLMVRGSPSGFRDSGQVFGNPWGAGDHRPPPPPPPSLPAGLGCWAGGVPGGGTLLVRRPRGLSAERTGFLGAFSILSAPLLSLSLSLLLVLLLALSFSSFSAPQYS